MATAELTLQIKDFSGDMLTVRAAALRLECATDYISKLCREGKLRGQRINQAWFIEAASLGEFEAARVAAKTVRARELSEQRKQELSASTQALQQGAIRPTHPSRVSTLAVLASVLLCVVTGAAVVAAPGLFLHTTPSLAAAVARVQSPFFGSGVSVSLPSFGLPQLPDASHLGDFIQGDLHIDIQLKNSLDAGMAVARSTSSSESEPRQIVVENGISATVLNKIVSALAQGREGALQYNNGRGFAATSTLTVNPKTGTLTVGSQLCLEDVCLSKEQLRKLLEAKTQ